MADPVHGLELAEENGLGVAGNGGLIGGNGDGIGRAGSDQIGGDENDQLGLLGLEVARAEQRAQDRNVAQARKLVDLLARRFLQQATDRQVVPEGSSTEVLASRRVREASACGSDTEVSTVSAMLPLDLTTGVKLNSTP